MDIINMNDSSSNNNNSITSLPVPTAGSTATTTTNPSPLSGLLLLITCYLAWPWLYELAMSAAALLVAGGSLLAQLLLLLVGLAGVLLSPAVGFIFVYLVGCLVFLQGTICLISIVIVFSTVIHLSTQFSYIL